jgi:hypothetical protein
MGLERIGRPIYRGRDRRHCRRTGLTGSIVPASGPLLGKAWCTNPPETQSLLVCSVMRLMRY